MALDTNVIHMPYDSNEALPNQIRKTMPSHVQDIYRVSFNSAWQKYKKSEEHLGHSELEEIAHRAAREAVEEAFHKEGDEWVSNES